MPESMTVAPYGTWRSPVTSDLVASTSINLGSPQFAGDDVYWLEGRPLEGGRTVLVKHSNDGAIRNVTPKPFNVRTRVHEYGGGAYRLADGKVYFSEFTDQRLYRQIPGGAPEALSTAENLRFADMVFDGARRRLITVCEDHTDTGREPVNTIAGIGVDGAGDSRGKTLVQGNDFYASPRISPDGSSLAWLTWNHPNMPWDGTQLWVGDIGRDGMVTNSHQVAGGVSESIFQPEWSPHGILHFVSDRSDWWNLYRWQHERIESLCEMEAEFGVPQWVFGLSMYGFASPSRIICAYTHDGFWRLAELDTLTKTIEDIGQRYGNVSGLRVDGARAVFVGSLPDSPSAVTVMDLETRHTETLRSSHNIVVDPAFISIPTPIEFPTESGMTAHGFFYAPKNRNFHADGDRPPLLVKTHGGPTSAASAGLDLVIQYWTSRGFAVLDVNYGGSSGYGRAYRQRLNGNWGIIDVDDVVNGALSLVNQGIVDGKRLAIDGGSAGGFTTLAVLTFRDVFRAGASYFGISDLESLAKDTHKFESRYEDSLIGPYPIRRDLYLQRSPINFVEQIDCPVILFQGLDDKVVPPDQAERIYRAVLEKGLPVAYIPFEGEQHGFRRAENIKGSLDSEFYFYSVVFGFDSADPIEPIRIENL